MTDKSATQYISEEKIVALELAVKFWGMTNQNPNTTPTNIGQVKNTADQFYHWLTS